MTKKNDLGVVPPRRPPYRVLVHGGGGSNGDWGVGVSKHLLLEEGRSYDAYVGISTGALSMAFLAQYRDDERQRAIEALEGVYLNLRGNRSIYRKWFGWPITSLLTPFFGRLRRPSLYDATPLREIVEAGLSRHRLIMSGKLLEVGACRAGGMREYHRFTETHPEIVNAVLASAAYPVMFQPVRVGGGWFVDGGLRTVVPLQDAVDLGAEEIDVICTSPAEMPASRYDPRNANMMQSLGEALETMVEQVITDDLVLATDKIKRKNGQPGYRTINVRLFRPSRYLGDSLSFGKDKHPTHEENIALGIADARKVTGWKAP